MNVAMFILVGNRTDIKAGVQFLVTQNVHAAGGMYILLGDGRAD